MCGGGELNTIAQGFLWFYGPKVRKRSHMYYCVRVCIVLDDRVERICLQKTFALPLTVNKPLQNHRAEVAMNAKRY